MAFLRTKSGLANYSKFFGATFTVFVEGGNISQNLTTSNEDFDSDIKTSDELFYFSIFSEFSSKNKFKIKSVGSKNDVETYANNISAKKINNCIVIFDSDYECVLSSWVAPKWIFRTNGYSWENDLWTFAICENLINILSGGKDWDIDKFKNKYNAARNRIWRLSKIEVFSRLYGKNLIIPKSKSIGIKLDSKNKFLISISEVCRVLKNLKSDLGHESEKDLNNCFYSYLKSFPSTNLIRGHLWENICMTLVISTVKEAGDTNSFPTDLIRNIALGLFKQDVNKYILPEARIHYMKQLSNIGL